MRRLFQFGLGMAISMTAMAGMENDFLSKLTEAPGASGFEKPVRQLLQKQWQPFMQTLNVDGMGNLLAQVKNRSQGPKLLMLSHMDEVGFMVESITEDGFLKVLPLGGISNSVVFAERWQVNTAKGAVTAYSGMDSVHILDGKKRSGYPELNALFMDIGASTRKQVMKDFAIRSGLSITPQSQLTPLGKHRVLAKALDDRLGLALITDMLEKIKSQTSANQLYVAGTVQEEVGLRGASTLYEGVHPDIAVNVEVGIADDYPPLLAERKGRIVLGKGPTVFVYDRSMIPNQELLNWVLDLAETHHIKVQLELEPGYGEDGAKIQVSGSGVPTINVGIPIRYAHQHASVFDKRDYQQAVKLLALIVENLNQKVSDQIKTG